MAFGTITVKLRSPQPEKPIQPFTPTRSAQPAQPSAPTQYVQSAQPFPPPPAAPAQSGAAEVNIVIAAPSVTEAEDFLCGAYFGLVESSTGTPLSVYTREFPTVTRLADLKSDLETAARKPTGTEIKRVREADTTDLSRCSITIGQTGNRSLTLDVNFSLVTPGASVASADAVLVILDMNDPGVNETKAAAERARGSAPVYWVITGFEETEYLWGGVNADPPRAGIKKLLRDGLGLPCRADDHVAYAQTYGGIKLSHRAGSDAAFVSGGISRDYAPSGCHMPLIAAIDDALGKKAHEGAPAETALRSMIGSGLAKLDPILDSWCENCTGDGGDETK